MEIPAIGAGVLEVELPNPGWGSGRDFTYRIDPMWTAPKTSAATISVTHDVSSWACSHNQTQTLRFGGAAWNYRVVTARSPAALAAGNGTSFVLPVTMELFFLHVSGTPTVADLPLGYWDCFGDTVDFHGASLVADVYALCADGSEQKVNAAPVAVPLP